MDARKMTVVLDGFAYTLGTLLQFDWSYSRYLNQSIYFLLYSSVILELQFIQIIKVVQSEIQILIQKIAFFDIKFKYERFFLLL